MSASQGGNQEQSMPIRYIDHIYTPQRLPESHNLVMPTDCRNRPSVVFPPLRSFSPDIFSTPPERGDFLEPSRDSLPVCWN
jgi:hypothetical protein